MSALRLQIRGPGNKIVRLSLEANSTYSNLVDHIRSSFPELSDFILHCGVPPKIVEIDGSNPKALLTSLNVKSGSTIIIELGGNGATMVKGSGWDLAPTVDIRTSRCVHYKVPGDNSCLFHSIGAALMRKNPSAVLVKEIKEVIKKEILANPKMWTISELGVQPHEYLRDLEKQSFWGGAIEIAIISAHYQVEISVVDFAALCVTTFAHYPEEGQDDGYKRRIYLFYDGSNLNAAHYDLLVSTSESQRASALTGMQASSAETDSISSFDSSLQSIFRPQDETFLNMVKKTAELSHERLVAQGKTPKRNWTEKDMTKNKKKKLFSGGSGALGETMNMGDHMQYSNSTKPGATTATTAAATTTTTPAAPVTPTVKPTVVTQPTPTPVTKPTTAPSTAWTCSVCTYSNVAARSRCEMCDSAKPKTAAVTAVPAAAPAPTPAVTKPAPATTAATTTPTKPTATTVTPAVKPTTAPKPIATTTTTTTTTTATPKSTASSSTAVNRPWTCTTCTYVNRPSRQECEMCAGPKDASSVAPTSTTAASSSSSKQSSGHTTSEALSNKPANPSDNKEGLWECQTCKIKNHPDAQKCKGCSNKRSDCSIM